MTGQMQQYSTHPILYSILYFLFNYGFDIQLLFSFQRVVLYSTQYLIFNYVSKIQLFIWHLAFHLTFKYSFSIQLFIKHSTIHSIN